MSDGAQTHFQELNAQEKMSKLSQLVQKQGKITCWVKGDKKREHFQAKLIEKEKARIIFHLDSKSKLLDKEVLYSFELEGLSFFGKAKLKKVDLHYLGIDFAEKLYKRERIVS